MSDNNSTDKEQIIHTKDTAPSPQNPAMLVKTPSLPVKTEFSQDESLKKKPETENE